MLEFGSHMSIAGGCDLALTRAAALEIAACQLFTKNASQWRAKPLDPAVIERFHAQRAATGMRHLVAHDSYLINIASPADELWEKSRLALMEELDRCDQLGVPYLVSHPGGHMGSGEEVGIRRVAEAINRIHDERPDGASVLLLETTAGQGTALGRTFEEIAGILSLVEDKQRAAVCLDTCHIFGAGYDLRDQATYDATINSFDEVIGLGQVKVIHLNDSKKALGSRVDRHAHIGEGELGLSAFELLVNDQRLAGLPGILETPKGDNDEDDRRNLATLRSLVREVAAAV
ncbi:MAG: deoxyribonuclease IV [Thermomicrobiales bacterium]